MGQPGLTGSRAGLGLLAWLVYRPTAQANAHHAIAASALPWAVILPAMALAVVVTYLAASRPARAVTRVPVVAALQGRPPPPKQVHRSALPGVIALLVGFLLLSYAGGNRGSGGVSMPEVVLGLVSVVVAVMLLSPLGLALLARATGAAPVAVRLAVRDLARYRSRSGPALAASRYGNVLDYVGPNLASDQLVPYTPNSPNGQTGPPTAPSVSATPDKGGPGNVPPVVTPSQLQVMAQAAQSVAAGLGSGTAIELDAPGANLTHDAAGRNFSGALYVATPELLRAFGISPSAVRPSAVILTMRPGLDTMSKMELDYGDGTGPGTFVGPGQGPGPQGSGPGQGGALANPVIQEVGALPSGTSAPNTVVTEHAVSQLHLQVSNQGWLIVSPHPLTAAQITSTQLAAAAAGLTVETRSSAPTSGAISGWATAFGVLLALGVLAMTVGLIRSETAADLRILTATGAGSTTRRSLTAVTAGALALLGAVLGTMGGYVATIGFTSRNSLDVPSSLYNIPVRNLLVILVGLPLAAAVGGWLLAGREPAALGRRPQD